MTLWFGQPDPAQIGLERTRAIAAPGVTHLRFRIGTRLFARKP